MVERLGRIEEARGSIPLSSTHSAPWTAPDDVFGFWIDEIRDVGVQGRPVRRVR